MFALLSYSTVLRGRRMHRLPDQILDELRRDTRMYAHVRSNTAASLSIGDRSTNREVRLNHMNITLQINE